MSPPRPSFRDVLARLDREGALLRLAKDVDARHLSPLVVKADRPVLFERVRGFDVKVAGGLFWNRRRLAAALGWSESELGTRFAAGVRALVEPRLVERGPAQEIVKTGRDVDLTELPIPLLAEKDGGPYISAGVVIARGAEGGLNAGVYRLMYRSRDETGIDLVTVSDLRRLYEARLARNEPLPISVSLGVHPVEILSAAFKAPPGVSEMAIAGGLHGAPVPLVRCTTIDVPAIADAEIVLEGELLPIGWTEDEGPFGEFAGMYGDLKANPVFKVTAITRRRDAVFQLLQMPWENAWLGAAATEAQVWNALKTAGVDVVNVAVTEGSACRWSAARTRCWRSWRCPTPSTPSSWTRTSTSTTPLRSSGQRRSASRPTRT
jgi:2,5-furandicarboxylate decarboxylase 1